MFQELSMTSIQWQGYISISITAVCILIILSIFIITLGLLWSGMGKIKKVLVGTLEELDKYQRNSASIHEKYIELNKHMSKVMYLEHAWYEFTECLIEEEIEDEVRHFNCEPASGFFNLSELVHNDLPLNPRTLF